ncbi:MAG: Smr/MutS family protein [Ignavibacteriae bacterium]|nr:Smr/MutS family protein [Ignavibacteriota bacterium]
MNIIYTIDIAHPPLSSDEAEHVLSSSLRKVQSSSHFRVLKIIHGYGSGGRGGTLKTVVQNWIHGNRGRMKLSIDGMNIHPFDASVQRLCAECHLTASNDLGEPNKGITIVWIK